MDGTIDKRFTALFHRHKNHLYEYAVTMLGNRDDAGDVVQETFIRMYTHLNNGNEIIAPKNWLFVSVRNLCLNRIRDSRTKVFLENPSRIQNQEKAAKPLNDELRTALQALDPDNREALLLREYQKLSYAEMADILDITIPAVRSLLYRARKNLRAAYFKLTAERKEP